MFPLRRLRQYYTKPKRRMGMGRKQSKGVISDRVQTECVWGTIHKDTSLIFLAIYSYTFQFLDTSKQKLQTSCVWGQSWVWGRVGVCAHARAHGAVQGPKGCPLKRSLILRPLEANASGTWAGTQRNSKGLEQQCLLQTLRSWNS